MKYVIIMSYENGTIEKHGSNISFTEALKHFGKMHDESGAMYAKYYTAKRTYLQDGKEVEY